MTKKTSKKESSFTDKAKVITIKWEGNHQGLDTKNFESFYEILGALEFAKAQLFKEH